MQRRDFLGSIIGFLVASQLPFKAEKAEFELSKTPIPLRNYDKFKIVFSGQHNIWTPSIRDIKIDIDKVTWFSEELHVSQTMDVRSMLLINPDGYLYGRESVNVVAVNGDIIRAQYSICLKA